MPRLVALTELSWDSRHFNEGDEFDANDAHAHLLRLTGKVRDKDAPAPAQEASAQLETRDMKPEESTAAPSKRANRYPRRDMRAQED